MAEKFKVVKGIHVQDGRTYHRGQSVSSDDNLCALFPGKFTSSSVPSEDRQQVVGHYDQEDEALADKDRAHKSARGTTGKPADKPAGKSSSTSAATKAADKAEAKAEKEKEKNDWK